MSGGGGTGGFAWRPLIAVSFGWFMVIVDATIVNVALPRLGREFGASVSGLQWVVDGYTVVFAGLLLSAGWLGDRFGGRRVFQAGLALFVLASAACGFATGLDALVGARVVQGVGAALLVPSSLALLQGSYGDRRSRARAIGVWAMVGGFASGAGPLLGGLLTAGLGWRWIFFVNVPVGAAGMLLTARWVRVGATGRTGGRFDVPGQVSGAVALLSLTAAMVRAGRAGWGDPLVVGGFALFAAATAVFAVTETRVRAPMLPPSLFRSRELTVATAVGGLMNLGFYGQLFVLTLYFQQVRGYTPLQTGLALLPQTGVIAFGSWLGGRVTARGGPRLPMVAGMAAGAAGFLALTIATRSIPYVALVVPMMATGFGISFTMPAATAAVVEGAPPGRTGIAAGTLNAARQVGGAVGIALLGAFVAGGASHFTAGLRTAMLVAAAAYALGALLALLVPRGVRGGAEERDMAGARR
ncbi:MFS transporter [Actinomadura montaniterrae]|uniref:MFS transporter n=1 Tax=Actinomadura montaniterrae TaxID=1803903 RepID=A0A6L3VL68_9ACTN|nr:MFS transporter [Actinomadura montaniterrae]KAB2370682.1 MFS transporter [Actinomadura montaniterrae]